MQGSSRRPRRIRRALGLSVAGLMLSAVAACGGGDGDGGSAADKDTFVFASAYGTPSFDPIALANPFQNFFLYPVYDRLVHLEPEGGLAPGLAEEWSFNEDATELTFTLREGVVFSDGEALDAEAVKTNIERSRDTPASAVASYLAGIEEIETPDESTVVLRLSSPDVSIVGAFAERSGMMISPAAIESGNLDTEPVGAGEYTLESYVMDDRAVFKQREDYWVTDEDELSSPNLEMRIFVDIQARNNAIRTGEADAGWSDAQSVDSFESADDFEVIPDPVLAYARLTFGTPVFEDVRVRKAVSMAIDREALNEVVFQGQSEAQLQPWPADYFAATDEFSVEQDIDGARALLAEAGQEDLTFTAVIPALDPHPVYAEATQAMLAEAGITMNLQQVEPAQIADIYYGQEQYDVLGSYFPGTPDPLITVAQTVLPDGFYNRQGIVSQPVVDAYEAAVAETDDDARVELLQELSAALVEEQPEVPLFNQTRPTVLTERVEGWEHYVSGVPEFRGVTVTE